MCTESGYLRTDYEFRPHVPEEDEDEEVMANASPPAAIAIHNTHI